jgi:hypothetical protein
MTDDNMDTDIAMQVLNASSVSLGGDDNAVKNSDRKSFVYKIFTKFVLGRHAERDATTIRYQFMGLAHAIVQASKGNSDSTFLVTPEGKRIDPQSSPTDPAEFQAAVKWKITEGRQSYVGATIILHSDIRFIELRNRILPFLEKNRIFIKPNFTESSLEEIVRVAIIPFMHHKTTFRKGFSGELNEKLQEVVNVKNAEFKQRYPCINEAFKFEVIVSKTKESMTFQRETVSTSILLVECPKSQSLLCRNVLQEALTLMSPTDDGPSRYNAVPLVLKNVRQYPKGPAAVFHILKQHRKFLDEFRFFQIKGVHRTTMAILKPTIMTDCPAINAIESNFMTDEFGKWTICSTKAKLEEAQDWIDNNLQLLMDITAPEDKPPVPKAVTPQRIISYAAVPDSQVDHLIALSGFSLSDKPKANAWGKPPTTATTHQSTKFSTLSESQTTVLSTLVTKFTYLESQLTSQNAIIASQNIIIADNKKMIAYQLAVQTDKLQTSIEEIATSFTHASNAQTKQIIAIQSKVVSQEKKMESINDRIDKFETNMSAQVAPLAEATQAGGLAALMQQTVLACLKQTQNQNGDLAQTQPMDEDFSQTPRKLFDPALSTDSTETSSSKKRQVPPSPDSRKEGQHSPVRARRDPSASDASHSSHSSSSTDDL